MRNFIFSDIHGCLDEFKLLFNSLSAQEDDKLIFVGDLVDKGPDSPGVVKFIRELSTKYDVVLVEGNHENKHRRFRKHLDSDDGIAMKLKGAEELLKITNGLDEDDIEFLNSSVMAYQDKSAGFAVVHAGVTPRLDRLPNKKSKDFTNKEMKYFNQLFFARYINPEGRFVSLGKETEEDDYWAEIYDGRFGKIYFGHQLFMGTDKPREFEYAVGLDLGGVHGGYFCCAEVDQNGNAKYHTQKAHKKYAKTYVERKNERR